MYYHNLKVCSFAVVDTVHAQVIKYQQFVTLET